MLIIKDRSLWLLFLCFMITSIYARKLPEEVDKMTSVHSMQPISDAGVHIDQKTTSKQRLKYLAGEDYKVLDTPVVVDTDKTKIEIAEVFWYGCPHCYSLEGIVDGWKPSLPKDVEFIRVPAFFGPNLWKDHAQLYYTIQSMGIVEKVHTSIFEEVQTKKNFLRKRSDMAVFLNTKFGIDKQKFVKSYNSISIVHSLLKASTKIRAYGLSGVPAMVVDGRYLVEPELAGSLRNMTDITAFLIEKVRGERSAIEEKLLKDKVKSNTNAVSEKNSDGKEADKSSVKERKAKISAEE